MSGATLFCANCGAANQPQAGHCFACQRSLAASEMVFTTEASSGRMVKQRYRLVRQVGTGGFGAVYLAEDTHLKDYPVALKEIRLGGLKPQEIIEATDAFNREVTLLSGLRHPSLPRVYDHFTDPEHWYLIMDFIEGETLESYMQKLPSGRLPVEMVTEMGVQLASVLHYLHSRQPPIIFRDLKPTNIMRTPRGQLYLIDFGIARIFKPGQARDTIAFGSPGYAPPEQYGKAQTTPQADLYSLGATLHALITGDDPANNPFHFAPLSLSLSPIISRLERLVMQMAELDASKRPASAQIVKQELHAIAGQLAEERTRALYPLLAYTSPSSPPPLYVPPQQSSFNGQTMAGAGQIQIGAGTARQNRRQRQQQQAVPATGATPGKRGFSLTRRKILVGLGALAVAGGGVSVYNAWSKLAAHYIYGGHANTVSGVAWSPDSSRIASSSWDKTVQIWDAHSGGNVLVYRGHSAPVWAVDWMPGGTLIASGDGDHIIHTWDASSNELFLTYDSHSAGIEALRWSPDGTQIASASDDTTVHVWDASSGATSLIYVLHNAKVLDVCWSPDGTRIVSCDKGSEVRIWDAAGGATLFTYIGHSGSVNAVAWSPDGTRIASAGDDGTVQVWNATDGSSATVYQAFAGSVWGVTWSADGRLIACANADGSVHVLNASNGQLIQKYISGAAWACNIAWSADNKYLAFTRADNSVEVWQP